MCGNTGGFSVSKATTPFIIVYTGNLAGTSLKYDCKIIPLLLMYTARTQQFQLRDPETYDQAPQLDDTKPNSFEIH